MYTEKKKLLSCSHRNLKRFETLFLGCMKINSWKCPPQNVFLLIGLEVTRLEKNSIALHIQYNEKRKTFDLLPRVWGKIFLTLSYYLCWSADWFFFLYIATIKEFSFNFKSDLKKHVSKSLFLLLSDRSLVLISDCIRFYFLEGGFSTSIYSLTNTRLKSSVIYAYLLFYIIRFFYFSSYKIALRLSQKL